MSINASTKRSPAPVAGKVGAPATKLATLTLFCVPMPLSPEVAEKYKLSSPRKSFTTGFMGVADVIEGDVLTVGGVDYHIRAIGPYTIPVAYTELILEQVQ